MPLKLRSLKQMLLMQEDERTPYRRPFDVCPSAVRRGFTL